MRDIFDFGLLVAFALAVVGTVVIVVTIGRALWPRKRLARLSFTTGTDGSSHIIPGPGHTRDELCICHPRVDGLAGEFVEHRDLKVRR